MNRYRIFIGDDRRELELPANLVIAVTYQLADYSDLTARFVSYTNLIKVPTTWNNQAILGPVFDSNNYSRAPYTKQRVIVECLGLEIFNGTAIIKTGNRAEYQIEMYEGAYSFFGKIEGKSLQDLDFEADDAADGSGTLLRFPLIDYGTFNENANPLVYTGDAFASLSYKKVLQKIFDTAGVFVSGNVLSEPILDKMYLAGLGYEDTPAEYKTQREFRIQTDQFNNADKLMNAAGDNMEFHTILSDASGRASATGFAFVPGEPEFYMDVTLEVTLEGYTGATPTAVVALRLAANGYFVTEFFSLNTTNARKIVLQLKPGVVKSNPAYDALPVTNSDLFVNVYLVPISGSPTGTIEVRTAVLYNRVYSAKDLRATPGILPQTNAYLPDMLQSEFIRDFAIRFGVLFDERQLNMNLVMLKDILTTGKLTPTVWTDKRDLSYLENVNFTLGSFAQNNYYESGSADDLPEDMYRGNLKVDNENLEVQKSYYTSPFSKTQSKVRGNPLGGYVNIARIEASELVGSEYVVKKNPVVYKSFGNIALNGLTFTHYIGLSTPGIITATAGQAVLVTDQFDPTANGVWIVAAGTWSRRADSDNPGEPDYSLVKVLEPESYYILPQAGVTPGTTPQYWAKSTEDGVVTKLDKLTQTQDPGLRLLLVRNNAAGDPVLANGYTPYTIGYFDDSTQPESLSWDWILKTYYKELGLALAAPKVVTRRYILNEVDIASLKLINVIEDNTENFIINKITNFVAGEPVVVELLKIL